MSKWQPIETAPKDGTLVDLWVTDGEESLRASDFYWEKGQWTDGYETIGRTLHAEPTHWMLPPEPP